MNVCLDRSGLRIECSLSQDREHEKKTYMSCARGGFNGLPTYSKMQHTVKDS